MTLSEKARLYAPAVLRIGISLVFLWFGSQQLINTVNWTSLIPESLTQVTGISATTFVLFNGSFEVVFGLAMLFGFFTRVASLLLALHMFHIMFIVGYGQTGVRDFGLAIATTAVFLFGPHAFTLDLWLEKRKHRIDTLGA